MLLNIFSCTVSYFDKVCHQSGKPRLEYVSAADALLPAEHTENEVHDEERAEHDHRDEEGDRHVRVPHGVQDLHAFP